MSKRSVGPPVYIVGLFLIVGIVALSGHEGGAEPGVATAAAAPGAVPDLTGNWVGAWQDTIYMVGGALSWTISQDGSDLSASGSIDLSALFLGVKEGTAEGTLTAALEGDNLDFTFAATDVGNGSGSISGTSGSGSGTVTAPLNFGGFTFEGTLSNDVIQGTFDFTSPTGGAGRALLTKQTATEPTSWGEIKAIFRGAGD
jgi:hypothetical protein